MPDFPFGDPTLFRWCFFRQQEGHGWRVMREQSDPRYSADDFADKFWQTVAAQAQQIGQTVARPAPHEFYRSDALLAQPAPELDGAGLKQELLAFTVADCFCLLRGTEKAAQFTDLTKLAALQPPPKLALDSRFYVGEVIGLVVEIEAGLDENAREQRATQLGQSWLGASARGPRRGFHVGPFTLWPLFTQSGVALVFLYEAGAEGQAVAALAYQMLPALALIALKWFQIKSDYDARLLKAAESAENALESATRAVSITSLRVAALEGHSGAMAVGQIALDRALADINSRLQTLRINARNLERLRHDARWGAPPAQPLPFESEFALLIEQIEADLHYIALTSEEATRKLDYLKTVTEIHSAQNERLIALVLSAFAGMAVAQVFPELPWGTPEPTGAPEDLLWRLGVTVGVAIVIGGLFVYGRARKVKIGCEA